MYKKKPAVVKKEPAPLPKPWHFSCMLGSDETTFCCALGLVGGFDCEDAELWHDVEHRLVQQSEDGDDDDYDYRKVKWDKIPAATIADLRAMFCAVDEKLLLATTVVRYKNGTVPKIIHDQGIANKVLPLTGWEKVRTFKGNTGNTLQLWSFDVTANKKRK